jgi:DNA adenine methylase
MTYPGGKNGSGVYQTIINLMPPHRVYVELFLGSGAIMRLKRPALASIGIDSDAAVIQSWQGLEMPGLTIIQGDALDWLAAAYATNVDDDVLIYLDPPYLMETRSCKRQIYRCEFASQEQHECLLDLISHLTCMVVISGYWSELYADRLQGWRSVSFQAQTRGGSTATEWVWMNFPAPLELHDYRYLGQDFRERERIKRKHNRWKARLLKMPDLERHAILSAIDELRSDLAFIGDDCRRPSLEMAVSPEPSSHPAIQA